MKTPPMILSSTVAAVAAFCCAWWLAQRQGIPLGEKAAGHTSVAVLGDARSRSTLEAGQTPVTNTPAAGRYYDPLLASALAHPDLAAAVKLIMDHQQEDHCADTRLMLLVELLPAERLAEMGAALAAHEGNDYIVRFLMQAWAQRDPAGARAWVESAIPPNPVALKSMLSGWARHSPAEALAWLDARPVSTAAAELRTALLETMSQTDAPAALALMRERGWLQHDAQSLLHVLKNWSASDPAAALTGLRSLLAEMKIELPKQENESSGGGQTFRVMLGALLSGATGLGTEERMAFFAQFTPAEIFAGKDAIVSELFGGDSPAAENLFTAPLTETNRILLKELAAKQPTLTLSKLGSLTDPALRRELLTAVAKGDHYSSRGETKSMVPVEAKPMVMETLRSLPESQQPAVAAALCDVNVAADPRWAAELFSSLPEEHRLSSALKFFKNAARSDAQVALEVFHQSSPEVQKAGLKLLAAGLATSAPEQGLNEILAHQDPTGRADAASTLFAYWAKANKDAAANALRQAAATLPLEAMLEAWPNSTHFRFSNGSFSESIETSAIQKELQNLIQVPATP